MDEEGEWEIVEHVITEYNEATGEWEVVDDDDDERFDAETEAMLKRLEERKSDDSDRQAFDAPGGQAGERSDPPSSHGKTSCSLSW